MRCEHALNIRHSWNSGSDTVASSGDSFYLPLPYFLIELQSDVGKVCDLLSVMGPFADDYNVSNFLFIPLTWVRNLFQSWTKNPQAAAVDGANGFLSRQDKTAAGRKKALILVVNKPDWFEPRKLTYLGFDNDNSEIPMAESDCIRFDIDYSDTNRRFADGSNYNTGGNKVDNSPLIAGAKKNP
jgi:hypothetical protein